VILIKIQTHTFDKQRLQSCLIGKSQIYACQYNMNFCIIFIPICLARHAQTRTFLYIAPTIANKMASMKAISLIINSFFFFIKRSGVWCDSQGSSNVSKNFLDYCRRNLGNMLRLLVTIVALAVLIDARFQR